MIPEYTHRPSQAVALEMPPVLVSRDVLRGAALSLVGGAAALWAATHLNAAVECLNTQPFIAAPILFAAVAAALPIQLLTLTRPLVREVLETSTAPALLKLTASLAVSAGSVLTALAWWNAFRGMCELV